MGGIRLFDAFRGPHWTLLTTDGDTAHQGYGAGVFLIRPDGCVGWAGETTQGLAEYAGRMGAGGAHRIPQRAGPTRPPHVGTGGLQADDVGVEVVDGREAGPGVYGIHSPRVPSAEETADLLRTGLEASPTERL